MGRSQHLRGIRLSVLDHGSNLVLQQCATITILYSRFLFLTFIFFPQVWFSAYLPISTSQVFDRFGMPYNISNVVDVGTVVLNVTSYEAYSPLYLPMTFATVYGIGFAVATSSVVHTALHYGPSIIRKLRKNDPEEEDIHFKLMKTYPDVPDWWYLSFLAVCAAISIVTITVSFPFVIPNRPCLTSTSRLGLGNRISGLGDDCCAIYRVHICPTRWIYLRHDKSSCK